MLNKGNVRRVFVRLLKRAELPPHFSPHCLRHTFASLLLQQGESPVYVQRQLGHASIKLTVDTYGKWLPMGNKAAVDRLDDAAAGASGSKVVAKLIPAGEAAAEVAGKLVSRAGLEPATPCLKGASRSNLSDPQTTQARKNMATTNESWWPSCALVRLSLVAAW